MWLLPVFAVFTIRHLSRIFPNLCFCLHCKQMNCQCRSMTVYQFALYAQLFKTLFFGKKWGWGWGWGGYSLKTLRGGRPDVANKVQRRLLKTVGWRKTCDNDPEQALIMLRRRKHVHNKHVSNQIKESQTIRVCRSEASFIPASFTAVKSVSTSASLHSCVDHPSTKFHHDTKKSTV